MALWAGAGRNEVSPVKSMFLVGYPHVQRMSTGIHDPLYASAVSLDNGSAAIILVSVDILFIHHHDCRRCRQAIHDATGVPVENIVISATHTHSGPSTVAMKSWRNDPVVPPVDPEYVEQLVQGIAATATQAYASRAPAEAAVTAGDARGVGGNRLSADGVCDPEVGILFVRRKADQRPLALHMVYSVHPTVMHEDSKLVSADFPGYARKRIEERLPGVQAAYHLGPAGNQSPRYYVSGQTFDEAKRLGDKLGDSVLAALGSLNPSRFSDDLALSGARTFVQLPPRQFLTVSTAREQLRGARDTYERLQREKAGHGPVRTAECTVFGAEEAVALAEAQAAGALELAWKDYASAEVQVLRVGDTFWACLPGEQFVEYGLDLKRRAPARTFVISLSSGELQGYIVTPEADAEGGYEAANSFFKPEAGRIMGDAALELIAQLSSDGGASPTA